MKIIFYGSKGQDAKEYAADIRKSGIRCKVVQADACREAEPCEDIEFLDVQESEKNRLLRLFGFDKPMEAETASENVIPIPEDWQALSWQQLRRLAGKLTDKAVINKREASEVIEAELNRRAA